MKGPWVALEEAEASWGRELLEAERDRRVAEAVAYASRNAPRYGRMFERLGLAADDIKTAADLRRIPCTTKDDLARDSEAFHCVPRERFVDLCTTSGTSGLPTVFPLTAGDIEHLGVNEYLSFRCAGLAAQDTVVLAVTLDRCFMAGLAYFEGMRKVGATSVRVGPSSPALLLSFVERLRPTAIVSVPSFLRRTALYAAEHGVDLRGSSVSRLVCIGEPIRDRQFELNPLGEQLASLWNARLYSTYGVTELGCSFCECEAGCGGHVHPGLVHVEILADDGEPVADGEVGEITATTLGLEAMPLLRYRTGDLSFMRRDRCACGRWTPRIGPILGRKSQMMKIRGTTVYPAAVQRVLDGLPWVRSYALVVTSPSPLSDELTVVAAVDGACDSAPTALAERLQAELKVRPFVRIAPAEEVERLLNPGDNRKRSVFIDRREEACRGGS